MTRLDIWGRTARHNPHACRTRDGIVKAAPYTVVMTPEQRRRWTDEFARTLGWVSAEAMRRAVRRIYGA